MVKTIIYQDKAEEVRKRREEEKLTKEIWLKEQTEAIEKLRDQNFK